jgi:hypothetical protein
MFVRLNTPLPGKKHWWMHCELNSWPVEVHGTLLFFWESCPLAKWVVPALSVKGSGSGMAMIT